jgi:hypothetical protein
MIGNSALEGRVENSQGRMPLEYWRLDRAPEGRKTISIVRLSPLPGLHLNLYPYRGLTPPAIFYPPFQGFSFHRTTGLNTGTVKHLPIAHPEMRSNSNRIYHHADKD